MRVWLPIVSLLVAACVPSVGDATPGVPVEASAAATPVTTSPATTSATLPPTTTEPRFTLMGAVLAADGSPVTDAVVTAGDAQVMVDRSGHFSLSEVRPGPVTVTRPAWMPQTVVWDGTGPVDVILEPRVVRAVRVSRYVAMDWDEYQALLDQVEGTAVNAVIFDTKDETGTTLYRSQVPTANEVGAVREVYDPERYIAAAKDRGLYTITRIVSFEDEVWTAAKPEAKLAGYWVDARNRDNWEYPLGLAVEACELGFDEIQFDYVRFPTGRAAQQAARTDPTDEEERVGTITAFLQEARSRLHPMGCALSAAIFGIVVSAPDDQGIGQRPEDLSPYVDAVSPMVYPSHYSPGWLGYADPNDYPGAVTADALEDAAPRLSRGTLLRPWLQAFYYNGSQVKAGIFAAEERGHGWLLWNAGGNYGESWLPTPDELPAPPDAEEGNPTDTTREADGVETEGGEVSEDQISPGSATTTTGG